MKRLCLVVLMGVILSCLVACSKEENKDNINNGNVVQNEEIRTVTLKEINEDKFITTKKNDEYKYDVYENHVEIAEYLGSASKVEIPSAIDGLTDVELKEGITYIGDKAFFTCTEIKSITIPESVTYIGDMAFETPEWGDDFTLDYETTRCYLTEIKGVKGSYAETYAKEKGIKFTEIG